MPDFGIKPDSKNIVSMRKLHKYTELKARRLALLIGVEDLRQSIERTEQEIAVTEKNLTELEVELRDSGIDPKAA
jgi:hypothetical protein